MNAVERVREQIDARGEGSRRTENLGEELGRQRKAEKLANVMEAALDSKGMTVDDIDLDAIDWAIVTEVAGLTRGPSRKTVAVVENMLRERARAKGALR